MDLYRTILMDGEEEIRQGITRKIDWAGISFCAVGDTENGGEALERVEALKPDLMLADIKMPSMDGPSLVERARQEYPPVRTAISSGYDDFNYAKQAIKLNVTEYILKPVNAEELTAILKRIKSNLDDEIKQRRDVSLLREDYIHSFPTLRDQFSNELVESTVPGNVPKEKLIEYDILLAGAKKWAATAIDVEPEEIREGNILPPYKERGLIPISVMQVVEEKLGNYCRSFVFTSSRTSWFELALTAAIGEDNSQTGLADVLGNICREAKKILGMPIATGIGHNCQDLRETNGSYKTTADVLGYRAIVGAGSTIYIDDVEPANGGKLSFDSKDEVEFIAAIKFGLRKKIRETVQAVMDKMGDAEVHFRQCQAYMLSMSSSIVQLIQQYDLDLEQPAKEGEEQGDTSVVVPRMMKEEDFTHWLLSAALRMNQAMNRERDNTMKQVIQKAKEYTMDNYQGPDLSAEKICRQLHVSLAYFFIMFKKETGQAYTAYLTQVRLDKAMELLNKTDDKTYIITAKVEYQEQNYFSYVFKKRFEVLPTEFRGVKQI